MHIICKVLFYQPCVLCLYTRPHTGGTLVQYSMISSHADKWNIAEVSTTNRTINGMRVYPAPMSIPIPFQIDNIIPPNCLVQFSSHSNESDLEQR